MCPSLHPVERRGVLSVQPVEIESVCYLPSGVKNKDLFMVLQTESPPLPSQWSLFWEHGDPPSLLLKYLNLSTFTTGFWFVLWEGQNICLSQQGIIYQQHPYSEMRERAYLRPKSAPKCFRDKFRAPSSKSCPDFPKLAQAFPKTIKLNFNQLNVY